MPQSLVSYESAQHCCDVTAQWQQAAVKCAGHMFFCRNSRDIIYFTRMLLKSPRPLSWELRSNQQSDRRLSARRSLLLVVDRTTTNRETQESRVCSGYSTMAEVQWNQSGSGPVAAYLNSTTNPPSTPSQRTDPVFAYLTSQIGAPPEREIWSRPAKAGYSRIRKARCDRATQLTAFWILFQI